MFHNNLSRGLGAVASIGLICLMVSGVSTFVSAADSPHAIVQVPPDSSGDVTYCVFKLTKDIKAANCPVKKIGDKLCVECVKVIDKKTNVEKIECPLKTDKKGQANIAIVDKNDKRLCIVDLERDAAGDPCVPCPKDAPTFQLTGLGLKKPK